MINDRLRDEIERLVGGSGDDGGTPNGRGAALAADLSSAFGADGRPRAGGRIDTMAMAAAYLDGTLTGPERDAYLAMLADSDPARLDIESAAALAAAIEADSPRAVPTGLTARAAILLGSGNERQQLVAAAMPRPWWRRRLVVAGALTSLAALLCVPALIALRDDPLPIPVDGAVPAPPPIAAPMAKRSEQFRAGEPEKWLGQRNAPDRKSAATRQFGFAERDPTDCDPATDKAADRIAQARDVQIVPGEDIPAKSTPIKKDCTDNADDQLAAPPAPDARAPEHSAPPPPAAAAR